MPVKRRLAKNRRLDDYKRQQLLAGPDACLLAGVGYLRTHWFRDMDEGRKVVLLEEMERDWHAHREELLAYWHRGADAAEGLPWTFVAPAEPGELPWASIQFDADHRNGQRRR